MKIVLAPDSFKGSISARDLCSAIRRGIHAVDPDIDVVELPLADGGEGTMENLVHATNGKIVECIVHDPLGRSIQSAYGILGDETTVVIEMAKASGLPLLQTDERNPLVTSSYGTGELISHALDAGYRRFIVGLGGSATNDGGAGMLKALGVRFVDQAGRELSDGGAALAKLALLDASGLDQRIRVSRFTIASDVTNPLCGTDGASAVFGPQKGATPAMVKQLDRALDHFGEQIAALTGNDVRKLPGSGAAGGMGAALLAFLQADFKPGIELVMEAIQFADKLQGADLIITGEGKLDAQTLSGKVIAGVCRQARKHGIATIALCGGMELAAEQMEQIGLLAGFSIVPKPCNLEQAMAQAAVWAEKQAEQLVRLLHLRST